LIFKYLNIKCKFNILAYILYNYNYILWRIIIFLDSFKNSPTSKSNIMNQNTVIPYIVSLNKLLSLTIDNYFINYEILRKSIHFYEYEKMQIKIHSLRENLNEGFSWYCGSTISCEEKKITEKINLAESSNPFKQQNNLLTLILEKNHKICSEIVANFKYKQIFIDLNETCSAQLYIVSKVILSKEDRKYYDNNKSRNSNKVEISEVYSI